MFRTYTVRYFHIPPGVGALQVEDHCFIIWKTREIHISTAPTIVHYR
jgi:hypothetical protein